MQQEARTKTYRLRAKSWWRVVCQALGFVPPVVVLLLMLTLVRAEEEWDAIAVVLQIFMVILVVGYGWTSFRFFLPRITGIRTVDAARQRLGATVQDDVKGITYTQIIRRNTSLQRAWKQFLVAQNTPRSDLLGIPAPIASTALPDEYITLDVVLGKHHGRLPHALPSVFAAIGLLGTFVGIAFGLGGINLESTGRMSSINRLMDGMSTAFLTSIVGISMSIWWRLFIHWYDRDLTTTLEAFLASVRQRFPATTPEAILSRIADDTDMLDESADRILDGINALGTTLGEAFETHLQTHVAAPLQRFNTDLGTSQQEALKEALKEMVELFQESLIASVGEKMSAFGKALQNASDHQVRAARKLSRFFDRLDEVSETQSRLLQRTSKVAQVFDSGLEQLMAAQEAIRAGGDAARATMEAAQRVTEESRRHLEAQEKSAEAAREAWKEQVEATRQLQQRLEDLTTDLAKKVEEFRSLSSQKITEVFHLFDSEMAKVTDHLGGTMAELRDAATALTPPIRTLPPAVEALSEATAEIAEAGRSQHESISERIQAFDKTTTELIGHMEGSLERVEDALGPVLPLAQQMREGNQALITATRALGDRLKALDETTQATNETLLADLRAYATSTSRASSQISETTGSMAEVTGRLDNAVRKLVDSLADLDKAGRARHESVSKQIQSFKDLNARLIDGVIEGLKSIKAALGRLPTAADQMHQDKEALAEAATSLVVQLQELDQTARTSGTSLQTALTTLAESAGPQGVDWGERLDATANKALAAAERCADLLERLSAGPSVPRPDPIPSTAPGTDGNSGRHRQQRPTGPRTGTDTRFAQEPTNQQGPEAGAPRDGASSSPKNTRQPTREATPDPPDMSETDSGKRSWWRQLVGRRDKTPRS